MIILGSLSRLDNSFRRWSNSGDDPAPGTHACRGNSALTLAHSVSPPLKEPAPIALYDLGDEPAPAFLPSLPETFLQDAARHITSMQIAVDTHDATALAHMAHVLACSSATMGALNMVELCQALQRLGRAGTVADARPLVVRLTGEFAREHQALHSLRRPCNKKRQGTSMLRHLKQTCLVIHHVTLNKCRCIHPDISWLIFCTTTRLAVTKHPGAVPPPYRGLRPWTSRCAPRLAGLPVMLCIVDTAGQAQCHHQDGILTCRPGVPDGAVCPGGTKRLLSACQDASQCVFGAVPVPQDAFGLLLLELRPPLFEVPRHTVVEGVILSASSREVSPAEYARLQGVIQALGHGLAPTTPQNHEPFPGTVRTACMAHPCQFARSTIQLTPRASKTVAATRP